MNAESLHREALVIDSHNDTIVSQIRRGHASITCRAVPELVKNEGTVYLLRGPLEQQAYDWNGQIDLTSLRAGGIDAAFFAVDVTRAWKNHLAYAMDAFGFFLSDLEGCPEIAVARNTEDLLACKREGRIAALLVVENSEVLEGSLNVLRSLQAVGVRSIVLTHNWNTWAAAGNGETKCGGGLTHFGTALVQEMNRLGMLVDVSHIAERGFWDTLEVSSRPVIASHSCCAAICPHPRNLTDEQLRALAQHGGVVGITFVAPFLDSKWKEADWPERPGLEHVVDHICHAVEVAGIDHVGIGSDFDGGGTALKSAAEYPSITESLLRRGFSEAEVRKILGENTLRVLRETIG